MNETFLMIALTVYVLSSVTVFIFGMIVLGKQDYILLEHVLKLMLLVIFPVLNAWVALENIYDEISYITIWERK